MWETREIPRAEGETRENIESEAKVVPVIIIALAAMMPIAPADPRNDIQKNTFPSSSQASNRGYEAEDDPHHL